MSGAAHAKAVELGKQVVRMTTAAGSGHPSSALALCHIVVELMYRRMRYDPANPWDPAGDRLVLSIGHAVPIIYAAYADLGGAVGRDRDRSRRLTVDDLSDLRELSSVLDGHPNPAEGFPFFDAATGSLGQGLSVAAGLALAARLDRIEKRVFVIAGDGESREGQVWEAADFMVDRGLTNVCVVFSCNGHGQAAPVSPQQSAEAIAGKAAAFGWHVLEVDGHDPDALSGAMGQIGSAGKPTAIVARTVKGWGVESIQGKNYHGKPLSVAEADRACAELDATGKRLGAVPSGDWRAPHPFREKRVGNGFAIRERSGSPSVPHPSLERRMGHPPPGGPYAAGPPIGPYAAGSITLPPFETALMRAGLEEALKKGKLATRAAYGAALAALGEADPRVVALDGDVSNSTFANLFARRHPDRFFECKIAEQNMVSTGAGLAAAGKIPFASSFGKFIARATDQIDMAAISRANLKIVGSHSGVSLGADGPSQMSLADVAYFRSMTRIDNGRGGIVCHVFHPCDAVSTYRCVERMANLDGLCYLRTHRPAAPFVYAADETLPVRGCKQLRTGEHLTIVSCGFMLHTVLKAAERLIASGVRCNVFDAYAFPLDSGPILEAARSAGGVILTVEDNYLGGLHAELAEAAAFAGDLRVAGMTARRIPKSAKTAGEVFAHVGVGLEQIIQKATELA